MTCDDIKNRILEANSAYRMGNPIIPDQEYDDLLESYQEYVTKAEYEAFCNSLNEGLVETNIDGKIKHPFTMGSMEKIKAECPEEVKKWISTNIHSAMSISAKVDGISFRC